MGADETSGRLSRIGALGAIEIREGLFPPAGLTIQVRSPDKKGSVGGVLCKLCRDSGDPLLEAVVGGREGRAKREGPRDHHRSGTESDTGAG